MNFLFNLKQPKNFSFAACLQFLNRGYDECLYAVTDTYVRRLIRISTGLILIQVSADADNLSVFADKQTTDTENDEIKHYVCEWFDLERDITEFYQLLDASVQTRDFSTRFYGLRLMAVVDLFEALCWCVIGQQINLTFAHAMKNRLVLKYGDNTVYDGINYHCFPTPQALRKMNRDALVGMQFSKQKIAYLDNISQAFCRRELDKNEMLKLSRLQQMDKLLAIKGVGPWTANYVSMKSLRNMSCIAYGDTGLSSALFKLFKTERKPDKSTIDKIFQPFSGWESYLNFYLWRSLSA